ncbi:zinc finger protein 512B isoform X2 [Oncorhynchus keta]|uniref:zinc finger protein 512B isoform X2 n=1 Tax=Oncorhynchus keta TaxID=8018 RepID=UPI00227B3DED|nr:zinc finger protein 512B isoform X2 [Oncorhynchus keta]
METPSSPRLGKLSSGGASRGRPPKQAHPQEAARTTATGPESNKQSPPCSERGEGKKKGRPRAEVQDLRSIPATLAEKLSHGCPDCEAVFATKVRLQKHKLWNHPERVTVETTAEPKLQKTPVKGAAKKRPMEITTPSPVFFKVKKTQDVSSPSQNGECSPQRGERKQHTHPQPPQHQHQASSSDTSPNTPDGSESDGEGGSLLPPYPDEDPERTRHRRKQKTPKKFTGEQPSISGTFGLKGMNKVEEKLKAGRVKRSEGGLFSEEPQRKNPGPASRRDPLPLTSGTPAEAQWQHAISERGEVLCPTCSIVTRKTVSGLKKHMEICQKLQDALKCQECHKQFRSKAGLNYHTMAEHSSKASGSEGQTGDRQEERERLRRVLKQMGRIKCPNEGCSAHFSSLMGYQYHQKRCGRELSEEDKPVFLCQHCGKTYRSKAGRDYHLRTEHRTPTTPNTTNINDTNNTNASRGVSTEDSQTQLGGRRELNHTERERKEKEKWQELSAGREKEREEGRERGGEREGLGEDFERTPSGRVRRRSAQVAVFHLQEIAEDELTKDWGTKRRIKDDLVPDSKRLNYTRPGLPKFSPKLLESWKNEVKEKGFLCCSNGSCEAVYSSVSGLKAHLANCNQAGGDAGKYTCLLCQKEFSSESGVKYHISKTHSQNWFRASSHVVPSSSKSKPAENKEFEKKEVKNGATTGKKRGRKPKEHPPQATPLQTKTPFSSTQISSSTPTPNPSSAATPNTAQVQHQAQSPTERVNLETPTFNRQPNPPTTRKGKTKRVSPPSE